MAKNIKTDFYFSTEMIHSEPGDYGEANRYLMATMQRIIREKTKCEGWQAVRFIDQCVENGAITKAGEVVSGVPVWRVNMTYSARFSSLPKNEIDD